MNATVRRIVARAPAPIRPGVELVVRTVADSFRDRVPGLSAEMAFYLILSLPPLLLTVFAASGWIVRSLGFDLTQVTDQLAQVTATFLTADAASKVNDVVDSALGQSKGFLFSLGFLVTLFSASRALRVTTVAITIAYDLEQTRPGWKQAVYGVALTASGLVATIVLVPVIVAGPRLGHLVAGWVGLDTLFGRVWTLAYWPAAVVLATVLLAVLYHVAAPWHTPIRRDLPGAALAMIVGLAGSAGLRIYVEQTILSDQVFSGLVAPLVLLLWLYVMSFAVLLGAEFNAEIERMWPTVHEDQPTSRELARARTPDRISARMRELVNREHHRR